MDTMSCSGIGESGRAQAQVIGYGSGHAPATVLATTACWDVAVAGGGGDE
ncbi:MAG: hypothetical protein PUC02_00555 [Bacteroidales bacterium]|nr:hypothetical protein [Bacteroidales bacterium]